MSQPPAPDALPPNVLLSRLLFGKYVTIALSVAAKIRLADHLVDRPKSVEELARLTGTHAPTLHRLLRALASLGVFAEDAPGCFRNTPMSEILRSDLPGSMRAVADFFGSDWGWRATGGLLESVKTGKTAFDSIFGEPCFDYLAKHPDESEIFNEAMTGFSTRIAGVVVEAYDFSRFGTIIDVGGGHGALLTKILKACPESRGIVFDLPHVVAGATHAIQAAGLSERCWIEGGSFFEAVPENGDVYVMKHIIHDWPDDKATTILRNCHRRMGPKGTLVLVEGVISPGNAEDMGKLMDLEMLALASGKERTEAEFVDLLRGAGFRLTRVVRTPSPVCVIEAVPI